MTNMPIMEWSDALDIGVGAMNDEHREILNAMNEIYDAHASGGRGQRIMDLVSRLGDLCVRHFADEERYMMMIGFPGLNTHKIIHDNLMHGYMRHASAIRSAGGKANDEFFGFLQRWLVEHFKGADASYGAYSINRSNDFAA
jgi:hemerythrin